jgi:hypothetical protein
MTPGQIPKKFEEKDQNKSYRKWISMAQNALDKGKFKLDEVQRDACKIFRNEEEEEDELADSLPEVPSEIEDSDNDEIPVPEQI